MMQLDGLDFSNWPDVDYSHLTGKVYVEITQDTIPSDLNLTFQYTAKTMSGKSLGPATITIATPTPPTLVDDTYTLDDSAGAKLPILNNDQPGTDGSFDISTLEFSNPDTEAGGYGTDYFVAPDGSPTYSGDSTAIHWRISGDKIIVTFGYDTPFDTPFTISYHIASQGGLEPVQDGVITVTRKNIPDGDLVVHVNNASEDTCALPGYPQNYSLLPNATSSGAPIDPASLDLDPFTQGQQTVDSSDNTIVANPDGSITIGYFYSGSVYYTLSDTDGNISNIGLLSITNPCM